MALTDKQIARITALTCYGKVREGMDDAILEQAMRNEIRLQRMLSSWAFEVADTLAELMERRRTEMTERAVSGAKSRNAKAALPRPEEGDARGGSG